MQNKDYDCFLIYFEIIKIKVQNFPRLWVNFEFELSKNGKKHNR